MRAPQISCSFSGHRPEKLPWGDNERDERCLALKDAIRQQPKKPDPAQTGEPVFIYTYRLATVKTQEAAKSEQKRYQSKGVQCVIRKLNSSFSLNMTLRGTEKDDAALRQKLKSAGLGAPMLLSKKKR